ncbi:MAG: hypothetical protein MZW92_22195 [Comamonadaceae bacterium]|nr:hypothetical protein [Comamonadaceae bacterium]
MPGSCCRRASVCPARSAAIPADPGAQAPAQCGRLSARGTQLVCSDGSGFQWRGVTAFALLEQIAHGRHRDADAYMRWAQATGFNLVRVLAAADVLFKLPADEGLRHMPALFEMAARRGLYVEIVALADSARFGMTGPSLRAQVAEVGKIAAGHANAVMQVANEHYHPTQSRELHDLAVLAELGRLIPPRVLYTESAAADDTATEPQGAYITRHLSRSGSPARDARARSAAGETGVEDRQAGGERRADRRRGEGRPRAPAVRPRVLPRPGEADVSGRAGRRHVPLRGWPARAGSRAGPAGLRPGVGARRLGQRASNAAISLKVSGPML